MCTIEEAITVAHNTCHPSASILIEIPTTLTGGANGNLISFISPVVIFVAMVLFL